MVTVMAATFRIAATTQVDQSCWSRGTSVDLRLIHGSFGPPETALFPYGISIGSSVSVGLPRVPDRQTDTRRQTTECATTLAIAHCAQFYDKA